MKKIKEYLNKKDKSFKEGVKLLLENDENLKEQHRKFLEAEADKDEPSKIARQLLESRLRKVLRKASQKQVSETKKKAIITEQVEPTELEQPDEPTEPEQPEEPKEEQPKTRKSIKKK